MSPKPHNTQPGALREFVADVLKSAFARLKTATLAYLSAWVLVDAFAGAVLTPLASWATHRMIRGADRFVVANEEILKFVLSPRGALAVGFAVIVALLATGIARAATLLIARECEDAALAGGWDRRRAFGIYAVLGALWRTPVIASLVARQTALVAIIAAPFIGAISLIAWQTVRGVDLYWLVTLRPARFWWGIAGVTPIALLMLAIIVPIAMRWSLSLPMCVLEGLRARDAMRQSAHVLKGRLLTVAIARLGWFCVINIASIAILALVHFVSIAALSREIGSLRVTAFATGMALLAHAAVLAAEALFLRAGDALLVFSMWRRWSPDAASAMANRTLAVAHAPSQARRRWILPASAVALAIAAAWISVYIVRDLDRPIKIEVTAHRGAATVAPENTLTAITTAIALGADRVEIDVMLTRDGEVVVFHDTDLRRMAADPRRIADMTLAELQQIDVGSWFNPSFSQERMPTLDEVIRAVYQPDAGPFPLNVELKAARGSEDRLAEAAAAVLRANNDDQSIITSLSARALEATRRADPSRRIGIILSASIGNVHRLDVDFYSVPASVATSGFIAASGRLDRSVYVWSVSDADILTQLALRGVHGVIASDVQIMRTRVDELSDVEPLERLLLAFRSRILE